MAPTIPFGVPCAFAAGTTLKFRISFADYPVSEGWALSVHLRGIGTLDISGTDVVAGTAEWTCTKAAATTAALAAGLYSYVARVSKAGDVFDAEHGVITVEANAQTAVAGALQTFAEKQLAAVEAQLATLYAAPIESYSIAGRSIVKAKIADLERTRSKLYAELWRERNSGKAFPVAQVAFGPAGSDALRRLLGGE